MKRNPLALLVVVLVLLVAPMVVFSQTDLPITGSIDDIKNRSKVYLIADNESRKAILKQLEKQKVFAIVNKPDDAEFFIEYKTISRQQLSMFGGTTETGQMDVYIFRDNKKVIAWSESTTGGGFKGDTANRLIKKFLNATKKK